ncbi:XRE family transcriptional regulator [Macrococcus hajekii]|uniref:XRE family transcriptional regulator n=1 Tax=Macrococcus hajekii TaxID=198482 RepID=A0A4R6BJB2_9STAP|nr:helix-turn-helix transcriptional regulator [Macrococcus hajekii]TDM01793.1 XRE family transcriptional regulator [Macrococcus hajekii]GGB07523.1 transcriptional regulator [Macrococcus hajekii]
MNIGNQIKYFRKELNLSQVELAEKIYVSSQTISNWENERSYPDLQNLIALSILFNVSLDELVKGDVVEMKNVVDKNKMDLYGNMMLGFMVMAAISVGIIIKYTDGFLGFMIPLVLWAISMYYAIKIERLKKKHDVQTYREILEFMENGHKINKIPRDKKKYLLEKVLIVTVFTAIVTVIMLISVLMFQAF